MASLETSTTSCRVCLRESLESYFEMNKLCYFSSDNKNFSEVLNFCTHLEVQVDDEFPQRICALCAKELQNVYEFLQKVLTSNRKLNKLKERLSRTNKDVKKYDNYIKDPLENATDNEDTLDNDSKSEENDKYSRTSFDNADNNCEYFQVNEILISSSTDNDDNNSNDFFKSVDSQIFPQGRLKCEICRKAYFTNVGLQSHMDIHLPKKKNISKVALKSGECIKKKKTIKADIILEENLKDRNITHDGLKTKLRKAKKMFPCEVCGKQMISASKLRYHMVMHTGEKDYLCTICPKAYSTIYALKHHMRAHTGERPYECKFCGGRFLRPTTLKSHMRRHTGERPYGCDICGKRFIQHSSMATHMKLNHMDKTIPCPYCDKKYARQTDLNTHLLSHSGDKPFSCQICPSRFTRQSNLNKHINQHHNNANFGDKKVKTKGNGETVLIASCENKDLSTGCIFEKPSCSLNLK